MVTQSTRFISMKRSGHHAIMMWIAEHTKDTVFFVNNIAEELQNSNKYNINELSKKLMVNLNDKQTDNKQLFFNLEDFIPSKQDKIFAFNKIPDRTIYIHRSPENLFSSRFKVMERNNANHWYGKKGFERFNNLIDYVITNDVFLIYYDLWCVDEDYRAKIGKKLCLDEKCKEKYKKESKYGGGSSFNKDKKNTQNRSEYLNKTQLEEILLNTNHHNEKLKQYGRIEF